MSYRIKLSKINKKEIKAFLDTVVQEKTQKEKLEEFFDEKCKLEIKDDTKISQFKIYPGFEKDEYPVHVLTKKDFREIINYYQHFLKESFDDKLYKIKKLQKSNKIDKRDLFSFDVYFSILQRYFDFLIKKDKLMSSSGVFLLDYFNLVDIYKSWKNNDRVIITHG